MGGGKNKPMEQEKEIPGIEAAVKKAKKPEAAQKKKVVDEALNQIVRLAGKDLDGTLPIERALWSVKGINQNLAHAIYAQAAGEMGFTTPPKLGLLNEGQVHALEDIVMHPEKHGVPAWMLNRRNDYNTGENLNLTGPDLDLVIRDDINRKMKSRSYQGVRHGLGLTVRGQRTKTSGRKGTTIGVQRRKDVKGSGK